MVSLTRKYAQYKWSDVHQKAFQYLKDSLTCVPLLSYPDSNVPYVLYTDASDTCIGACLTQVCDGEKSQFIICLTNLVELSVDGQ